MTVSELIDEIGAIDAIYPESANELAQQIYNFIIPEHEKLTVQISFPSEYPVERPQILQVVTKDGKVHTDEKYIERHLNDILDRIFNPGDVCIFEFLTEVMEFLEIYEKEHKQEEKEPKVKEVKDARVEEVVKKTESLNLTPSIDPLEGWTISDQITDRGSTFIAYVRPALSVKEAQDHLDLLTTDKKIARAAHNISSWRIKKDSGVQYQDFDDDGETAAGSRLLHLLTVCIH